MTKGEIQAFHTPGLDAAAQTHRLQSRSFAAEHLGVDLFELTPHLHFAKLTVQQCRTHVPDRFVLAFFLNPVTVMGRQGMVVPGGSVGNSEFPVKGLLHTYAAPPLFGKTPTLPGWVTHAYFRLSIGSYRPLRMPTLYSGCTACPLLSCSFGRPRRLFTSDHGQRPGLRLGPASAVANRQSWQLSGVRGRKFHGRFAFVRPFFQQRLSVRSYRCQSTSPPLPESGYFPPAAPLFAPFTSRCYPSNPSSQSTLLDSKKGALAP
jgi:hypothetical protein